HAPSQNAPLRARLPASLSISPKLAGDIHVRPDETTVRAYIVRLRQAAVPAELSALRRAGARVTRRYHRVPLAAVSADGPALARLVALPEVTHISPDLH